MRIRTIKPDFWLHEGLATRSPLHRLLFVGLWQIADREGRLEYRPLRIRAALFPYEPIEVSVLVDDLVEDGHLQVYGEHQEFISIPGFLEHQRPHPKEPKSTFPEPPARESRVKKRRAVFGSACIPSSPVGREGKGMDKGKGREGVSETTTAPPEKEFLMPPAEDPPDKFADSGAFEEWFQFKRREVGFVREKRVSLIDRGKWWTEVHVTLKGDPTPLEQAVYKFAKDPFWEAASPPMPFRAFMSEWPKYLPQLRAA